MFTEGQKVWCALFGAGVIEDIRQENITYPVVVRFIDGLSACYTADGNYHHTGNITLFLHPVEIVKAIIKPSIDWSHVSPEYGYLFQDSDGEGYLCHDKPSRIESGWNTESHYISADVFTSYVPGNCDWEDSLVKRPN